MMAHTLNAPDSLAPLDPYWQQEFARRGLHCTALDCTAHATHLGIHCHEVGRTVVYSYLCAEHAAEALS